MSGLPEDVSDFAAQANAIVARFSERLIALARRRLWGRLNQRIDPEDVVQSAFGSFFRRASEGAYAVSAESDLWSLLATITINKLRHQRDHHLADKRSIDKEVSWSGMWQGVAVGPDALSEEPTDHEAKELVEELEAVLTQVEPHQREIIGWKLEGVSNDEIAQRLDRTERTVRRALEHVHELLERRLNAIH